VHNDAEAPRKSARLAQCYPQVAGSLLRECLAWHELLTPLRCSRTAISLGESGSGKAGAQVNLLEKIADGGRVTINKAGKVNLSHVLASKTIRGGTMAGDGHVRRFQPKASHRRCVSCSSTKRQHVEFRAIEDRDDG